MSFRQTRRYRSSGNVQTPLPHRKPRREYSISLFSPTKFIYINVKQADTVINHLTQLGLPRSLRTCVSDVTSSCKIFVRPELSSFNKSASLQPVRFVNPAKTVNPKSSSLRARHHARGDSQPVIKIAFPTADTCWLERIRQEIEDII